jgi:autotransporter passenger strand-loop-strand repeat protein
MATGVTVSSADSPYNVSSGQTDTSDIVVSRGSMFVLSGGTASATTINNGGAETVSSLDISAVINSGGTQPVFGSASGAIVQSSGVEIISSGGSSTATRVTSGGTDRRRCLAYGRLRDRFFVRVLGGNGLRHDRCRPHIRPRRRRVFHLLRRPWQRDDAGLRRQGDRLLRRNRQRDDHPQRRKWDGQLRWRSRPPGRSAANCPPRCSPSPTRSSSKWQICCTAYVSSWH